MTVMIVLFQTYNKLKV